MTTPATNALALRCERCGDSFSAQLASVLVCPTCGHRQAAPTVVTDATAYEQSVSAYVHASKAEAKMTDLWHSSSLGGPLANALPGLSVAALSFLGVAYWLFMRRTFPDLDQLWVRLIAGGILLTVIGLLAWLFRDRLELTSALGTPPTRHAAPAASAVRVACPRCGAPSALRVGEGVDQCRFCRAAMVASPTAIQQGVAIARAAHVQSAQTRRRAERRAMIGIAPWTTHRARFVWIASGLMLTFSLSRFVAASSMFGSTSDVLWGLGALALGAAVLYFGLHGAPWEQKRRAKWRAAELELCAPLQGTPLTQVQTYRWLDRNWPEDLPTTWYFESKPRVRVSLSIESYALLVVIDPGAANEHSRPRAEVFLAAEVPGVSGGSGPAPCPHGEGAAARTWLTQQGFSIHIGAAGLVARAHDDVVARLARDPSLIAGMATVVSALPIIARSMSASPATPME